MLVPVQKEWLFTYRDSSNNVALGLGTDGSGMTWIVDGVSCAISTVLSPADFTSQMKNFCVVWSAANGRVEVYSDKVLRTNICTASVGHTVPAAGLFQLGGKLGLDP